MVFWRGLGFEGLLATREVFGEHRLDSREVTYPGVPSLVIQIGSDVYRSVPLDLKVSNIRGIKGSTPRKGVQKTEIPRVGAMVKVADRRVELGEDLEPVFRCSCPRFRRTSVSLINPTAVTPSRGTVSSHPAIYKLFFHGQTARE